MLRITKQKTHPRRYWKTIENQFNSIQLTLGDDKKKIKNKKNAKGKRVEPLNKNQHHRSCPTQNLEWRNSLGVL